MRKFFMVLMVIAQAVLFFGIDVLMPSFNSSGMERMPCFFENTIYYAGPNYDIFFSRLESNQWTAPQKVPGDINTAENEISPLVLRNGGKLVMYFGRYISSERDYDFFRAEYNESKQIWENITLVPELCTTLQDWDIWVDSTESTAYVTTKGSFGDQKSVGGRDIWMSKKTNGKWSVPVNVSEVNSSSDEWSVAVAPDGKIWFDSSRSDSIGGYDLYCYDPAKKSIEHPAEDINTMYNERSPWTDGKLIVFSSADRKGNAGGYDIYIATLPKEQQSQPEKTESVKQDGDVKVMTITNLRSKVGDSYVYDGQTVEVEGTACVSTGQWHDKANYFSITDGTSAVLIYANGFAEPKVKKGDLVRVRGKVSVAGYTSDVNSLFVLPQSPEDIKILSADNKLPEATILFTDTSKENFKTFESMPITIFGKLHQYDNDGISRGFYVDGSSDKNFDDQAGGIKIKFYSYADVDITNLSNGDFVTVNGILVQDKDKNFYIRLTDIYSVKKQPKKMIDFLTTVAKADLVAIEQKPVSNYIEYSFPKDFQAITGLKVLKGTNIAEDMQGSFNGEKYFLAMHKLEGTRTSDMAPWLYMLDSSKNTVSRINMSGEVDYIDSNKETLIFSIRVTPENPKSSRDIYLMNLATNKVSIVSDSMSDDIEPAINSDSTVAAFTRIVNGRYTLILKDLKSGKEKVVCENARKPSWKGASIVFQVYNGSNWDIAEYDSMTSKTSFVLNSKFNEFYPAVSKNGDLLFIADYDSGNEVYVYSSSKKSIVKVIESAYLPDKPFWAEKDMVGATIKTGSIYNLAAKTVPPSIPVSGIIKKAEGLINSPRFGCPSIILNNERILKVALTQNTLKQVSISGKSGSYTVPVISDARAVIPSYVPDGLYDLNIISEKDGVFYESREPNCVFLTKEKTEVKILQITDTHMGLSKKSENKDGLKVLIEKANNENADFIVITGDITDSAQYYEQDYPYLVNTMDELCDLPVFVIPGNHDSQSAGKVVGKEIWKKVIGPVKWSFTYANWYFIGMDTGDNPYGLVNGDVSSEQISWLAQELKTAKDNNMKIALFAHHNMFDTRWNFFEKEEVRSTLARMLSNSNVLLAAFGHRHSDTVDLYGNITAVTTQNCLEKEKAGFRIIILDSFGIKSLNMSDPITSF